VSSPREPPDRHRDLPRRHRLRGRTQHVEDHPPQVGEPLGPVLHPKLWNVGAARGVEDRQGGVEVDDVGAKPPGALVELFKLRHQLGALLDQAREAVGVA
jgi:hypothetical protein